MKLNKPYTNKQYAELAIYCNQNNCHIEDKGDYLEAVANPPAPEPSYAQKRAAAYPLISEQLDMLYWDKVNGTSVWQETIAAVKATYLKPDESVQVGEKVSVQVSGQVSEQEDKEVQDV